MKKFNVFIEETLSRCVTVEAEGATQAREIVRGAYNNERIVLVPDDCNVGLSFDVVEADDEEKVTEF